MNKWGKIGLLLCFLASLSSNFDPQHVAAQEDAPLPTAVFDPTHTTAHDITPLHEGPGDTFLVIDQLNPGVEVSLVERNRIGNWLRINRITENGQVAQDGWARSGHLNLAAGLRYSQLPVNRDLADADPSTVNSRSMAALYAMPVIPQISEEMRAVFARGISLGNNPGGVTKVGDSLSASDLYLNIFSNAKYNLGPYDYLAPALHFFGPGLHNNSVAAEIGMSSLVVFDPLWADSTMCEPGESPLACEYRTKKPAIAMIMFGPNDVRSMDTETYSEQMRQIVYETLERGIIPVLWTFSTDPDDRFFWPGIEFNLALLEIAQDYDIPLVNLWAAARALPAYGLEVDRTHLKFGGYDYFNLATGQESYYGATLQNLLALRVLDELRRTLDMDG